MTINNCAVCRLPMFDGPARYAGMQCQCYWNQRREFLATTSAAGEEHELRLAEAQLAAAKKRVEAAWISLAMKRAAIARAPQPSEAPHD